MERRFSLKRSIAPAAGLRNTYSIDGGHEPTRVVTEELTLKGLPGQTYEIRFSTRSSSRRTLYTRSRSSDKGVLPSMSPDRGASRKPPPYITLRSAI